MSVVVSFILLLSVSVLLVGTLVPVWGMSIVQLLFSWTFIHLIIRLLKKQGVRLADTDVQSSLEPELQLVFLTIYDPDLKALERNLKRIRSNFRLSKAPFYIFAVVDGVGACEGSDRSVMLAEQYCDVVGVGNAQRKRVNLAWMIQYAWKQGLVTNENAHNVIMHFIDDDTLVHDDFVASRLCRHFADSRIGCVATAQYVHQPTYFLQHVLQVFETARNYGSQAVLSLFGAIGCAPGRWFAVRASYIGIDFADRLASETISLFGFARRLRDPGDDRLITLAVQLEGGRTIMAVDAVVYTDAPKDFRSFWGMITRWARSSNIYTIQYTATMLVRPWMWPTLLLYWSNIGLAFGTVYIAGPYFVYQILYGDHTVTLLYALLFMFMSMALTMLVRQIGVVMHMPVYFFMMFIMGFLGIMMQTAQVWGMLTFLKSKWTGVRQMGGGVISEQITLIQPRPLQLPSMAEAKPVVMSSLVRMA